jgi:hypothetical protein
MNDMNKKIYVSPTTERVGIRFQSYMLAATQTRWGDAKTNDRTNLWSDDELGTDDEDNYWDSYTKNKSIW